MIPRLMCDEMANTEPMKLHRCLRFLLVGSTACSEHGISGNCRYVCRACV